MRKIIIGGVLLLLIVSLIVGIARRNRGGGRATNVSSPSGKSALTAPSPQKGVVLRELTEDGGRVDWYQGGQAAHQLIAFDAVTDARKDTQVFLMSPDGSGRTCVTCGSNVPKGFTGQPAWAPDGEHLVIQAENKNSAHAFYNHESWGFDEDLWIINRDGTGAQKIWSTPPGYAALHPHFSLDGHLLIFAERVPTGKRIPLLAGRTPGGENPWDGWRIHVADVDLSKSGPDVLSNHRTLYSGTGGFYETHGFLDANHIVFSHTANGEPYVDDIFSAYLDGSNIENLTRSPSTWDEHGIFSSSKKSMAFISSRADAAWRAPTSKADTLRTELFLMHNGRALQLTEFNKDMGPTRYLVSDYDWNRAGDGIVFQVAPIGANGAPGTPQIWLLQFSEPQ